jgi:Fe-S cluster biosynthesis and repair protein YggX
MELDEEVEQDLRERTEEMIEHDVLETEDSGLDMKHKSGEMDEEVERKASSKTGASWNAEEIEFLARQKTGMDNEELREFLAGNHEVREDIRNWEPFSRTEEKYLMQNIQGQDVEEVAEHLDRDPQQVEIQLKIMGLDHLQE